MPGSETLNYDILAIFSIGNKRVAQYFQKYYITDPFAVERSEKDAPLTKILTTSLDRRNELKKAIDAATSVLADELKKALDKERAGRELKDVARRLNQLVDSSSLGADGKGSDNLLDEYLDKITVVNLGKMGKDIRIKKLIELRTEFFNRDQSAKSMLEEKARLAFKKKYPDYSEASHLQSLNECKLYKLCDKVLRRDRYN